MKKLLIIFLLCAASLFSQDEPSRLLYLVGSAVGGVTIDVAEPTIDALTAAGSDSIDIEHSYTLQATETTYDSTLMYYSTSLGGSYSLFATRDFSALPQSWGLGGLTADTEYYIKLVGIYWDGATPYYSDDVIDSVTTDPIAVDTLMYLFSDSWNGTDATFDDSIGVTFTRVGTPGKVSHAQFNGHDAIDFNTTDDYFTFDTLTHNQDNYAIFAVWRQQGTTASGYGLDFRSGSGWRMILPMYRTSAYTNGYLHGQSSNLLVEVTPDTTAFSNIRLWLFEDGRCEFYNSGGTALIDSTFEDTALDQTLRLGLTSSISLDLEICHVSIFRLPDGETFTANFINQVGNYLESIYYNGTTATDSRWQDITR